MIEGQPSIDVFGLDIARFDPALPKPNAIARAREFYSRRFDIPFPNESWPVGRPLKTTPLYDIYQAKNAVFLASFGIEAPAYFALEGDDAREEPTFYRSNAFAAVGEECRAVREKVGILEFSAVAKFEVSGPDALAFLRKVVASPLPELHRSVPGLMLSATGRMIGDLSLSRTADHRYFVTAPTFVQALYMRWFEQHVADMQVRIENVSERFGGLFVCGPGAPALMEGIAQESGVSLPPADAHVLETAVGDAPCLVIRSDRLGAPGFEIYTPLLYLQGLYRRLISAGASFPVRDIGVRAYSTLAMESNPGVTLREISQDHTAAEAGFEHLLDGTRNDYIGAGSAVDSAPGFRLVGLRVDAVDADPVGDEPVWIGEEYVGYTSSGCYGHTVGYAIALAFLSERARSGPEPIEVSVLGRRRPARIVPLPFGPR